MTFEVYYYSVFSRKFHSSTVRRRIVLSADGTVIESVESNTPVKSFVFTSSTLNRGNGFIPFLPLYHGQSAEEQFRLIPAAEYRHRTTRQNTGYHCTTWNCHWFSPAVLPDRYDLWSFSKRNYFRLKCRQRVCKSFDIGNVHGRR